MLRSQACSIQTALASRQHNALAESVSAEIHSGSAAANVPLSIPAKYDIECQMLVIGSGPGGYAAAFRAADLGLQTLCWWSDIRLWAACA